MKALKVSLRNAEKVKKELIKKKLYNNEYIPRRIDNYLLLPIKQASREIEGLGEVIDVELEEKKRVKSLKEIIKKITGKDIGIGIDIVGEIIIVHLSQEISEKEKKELGKQLLRNYNVRTVYLKKSERKGIYRLEELELIAGIDNPLTIHRENNYSLWVDVKKTYFSPRLANDRKKVLELINPGDEVLVMFSGIAPYVVSLSRKARIVVGIELNRDAHLLARKNVSQLRNAIVIHGDAMKSKELINQYFLGLKSRWNNEQLSKRINHTKMIEIYLASGDIENHLDEVRKVVQELQEKDYRVMIHTPFKYKGIEVALSTMHELEVRELFNLLEEMGGIGYVVHPARIKEESLDRARINLKRYGYRYKSMYIENLILGETGEIEKIIELAKQFKKYLCIDTAHALIKGYSLTDIAKLLNNYDSLLHLHVSDAKKGEIKTEGSMINDVEQFLSFLNKVRYSSAILEIIHRDEENPRESLINLSQFYKGVVKRFDHIFMPLPKDSHRFIDPALTLLRSNGFIHMYRFLSDTSQEEKELMSKGLILINKEIVGEHSPGIYRYRLDLQRKQDQQD